MDRAPAVSEGDPGDPEPGRPPSIGVPSIPALADRQRTPAPVPSVPLPSAGSPESAEPVDVGSGVDIEPRPAPASSPTRRRVPVVSTRSMPLPVGRGEQPDGGEPNGSAGPGAPDPADQDPGPSGGRDPFALAFPPGVAAKLGWYVYLMSDPRSGQPFYVGRGRGDRCFRHLRAARVGADAGIGAGLGAGHAEIQAGRAPIAPGGAGEGIRGEGQEGDAFPVLERIREVEAREGPIQVEILRYRLSADEARLVQAATADLLGIQQDLKLGGQRQPAADLGTRLAKRAKFKREHQVVLLRIGDRGADTGYGTVRHDWRIGRRWIDPRSSRSPRWAVIVAGELIVAVYRIEGWEPTPLPGPPGPPGPSGSPGVASFTARSTYRHSFIGEVDDELERRYVGRSVAAYLTTGPRGGRPGMVTGGGVGAQNQVTYVWCGPHWVNPTG